MTRPDPVLDSIDHALRDYETSADAMRWTPDAEKIAAEQEREAGNGWTAYCAPGHSLLGALVLALRGENVTGIEETAVLQGSEIILVNQDAIADALSLDRLPPVSEPGGILSRPAFDPLRMLCEDAASLSARNPVTSLLPQGGM
jgi:hypothetical protein